MAQCSPVEGAARCSQTRLGTRDNCSSAGSQHPLDQPPPPREPESCLLVPCYAQYFQPFRDSTSAPGAYPGQSYSWV